MNLNFTPSQSKKIDKAFQRQVTLKKPRKNMDHVACAVNKLKERGHTHVTSLMVRDVLTTLFEEGLSQIWSTNPDAADCHGITRSIGDILGKHGLRLTKDVSGYQIPSGGITAKYITDLGYSLD